MAMIYRRDFLRALALGTGAILVGRGWYKQGSGLLVPGDPYAIVAGEGSITVLDRNGLVLYEIPPWRHRWRTVNFHWDGKWREAPMNSPGISPDTHRETT